MNNFFTSFTGYCRLAQAFANIKALHYGDCTAPQGALRLRTCWGSVRKFFFSFREFAFVDGRLWSARSVRKFLGLVTDGPVRVFVVVYSGDILFFYRSGISWQYTKGIGADFHSFTDFISCPRKQELEFSPYSRRDAIDLQKYLERSLFELTYNAVSESET